MDSSTNHNVDMAACNTTTNNSHSPPPPRRLCIGGCGFFGLAESRGLCSKCYKDYLHQSIAKFQAAMSLRVSSPSSSSPKTKSPQEKETGGAATSAAAARRGRCGSCSKKVGLLGFVCRCKGSFCSKHRHPESHACSFDFKKAGKEAIEKENPPCVADKISRI